jgi:hypothetical protein
VHEFRAAGVSLLRGSAVGSVGPDGPPHVDVSQLALEKGRVGGEAGDQRGEGEQLVVHVPAVVHVLRLKGHLEALASSCKDH